MGANCFKMINKIKIGGKICFYWVQIKIFLGANVSGKGAFFYVWGHLVLWAFVNGGKYIFSGGNFKIIGGKCVSEI